ncbi:extracellular solute-binding protein [Brevibacillus choshinensis]|uniref:sugar ABC transporter substrate-binding protein n=1 Tax=Brevibacillus choshinensis TaxID=54911 RepID=UPI002E1A5EB8|nr:hypothetical protein [Brevibacillus choshinensis]
MKKIRLLLLTVALTCGLTACGNDSTQGSNNGGNGANGKNQGSISADSSLPTDKDGNKIVHLKVFTRDSSAPTRVTNFDQAAKNLNKALEAEGADYRVEVEQIVKSMNDDEFNQNFIFASQSGNSADIYTIGYSALGWMADGGYITALNGIEKEEVFKNLMNGYWNPVSWKGNIYGVVQDTEARVVYFNKDALRSMGWSEEAINDLPVKAESGEFTLDDMIDLAEKGKKAEVVKYGYEFDGGNNDNPMNFYNFGAEIYNWEDNKFVLNRAEMKDTFTWMKESVDRGVIPANNISTDKKEKLIRMLNGKTLFVQAGIWDEAKFRTNGWHEQLGNVTTDWIEEHVGVMNLPVAKKANTPITVSNPWVYLVSSNSKYPDVAKRLLVEVSAPEFQAKHGVETSHIPFTKEGQEHPDIQKNAWLNKVKHYTNYSKFVGNHPDKPKYDKILKDASNYVMTGEKTPEDAVKYMEDQMKLELKEGDYIIK